MTTSTRCVYFSYRRYVSWRNNPAAHRYISSLRYFESIINETEPQQIHPDYWGYLEYRIHRDEQLWIQSHQMVSEFDPESSPPNGGHENNELARGTT